MILHLTWPRRGEINPVVGFTAQGLRELTPSMRGHRVDKRCTSEASHVDRAELTSRGVFRSPSEWCLFFHWQSAQSRVGASFE